MAICGNCGAESSRVRTTFHTGPRGKYIGQTDVCLSCSPGTFDVRWKLEKVVPAWEAYPNQYRKTYAEDGGVCYVATEESRTDLEERVKRPCPDDVEAKARAIRRRREWANSQPKQLSQAQIESINSRREELLSSPAARIAGVHSND